MNERPVSKVSKVERARGLRLGSTEAERRLWRYLRDRGLGFKFRRQRPIGGYIVDCACLEARLIVEVDGGQHAAAYAEDTAREQALAALGFRVIRVWNHEVMDNIEGVLATIAAACDAGRR